MTATAPATTDAPTYAAAGPASPPARRLGPPRWRDKRLGLGVLLVVVAVVLGATLLGRSARTDPVLVAARPLPAGHVLTAGDLTVGHVRLGGAADAYWSGDDLAGLTGHPLTASVGKGDLLPRSAVGASAHPQPTRVVSVPVDPGRLPDLSPGDVVDVFATSKGDASRTVAVLRGVRYLGGGDTGSGSTVSVRLEVPVDQTAAVIRASEVETLDVVLQQPAGDDAGDVGSTPQTQGAAASPTATP